MSYSKYELIVVDNASEDNSADVARRLAPDAHLICNTENVGFAAGSNQGFAAAQGDVLVGLNPDTTVSADWLTHLVAPFADPAVGLTTPRIVLMDAPETINACGNEVSLTGLTFCIGVDQPASTYNDTPPHPIPAISGAAFAMSRACYAATGGFDPTYFTYFEDTDLSLRAAAAGFKTLLVSASVVRHDYQFRMSAHKMYWIERNRQTTLLKCLQPKTRLKLLPALLLGEGIAWGYALLHGRATLAAKGRALWWLMRSWHKIERPTADDRPIVAQMTTRIRFDQAMPGWIGRILCSLCESFLRLNKWFVLRKT